MPAHSLEYYVSPSGESFGRLSISHALIDASSRGPLYRDLALALSNHLPKEKRSSYAELATQISKLHRSSSAFWKDYLSTVKLCKIAQSLEQHENIEGHGEISVNMPPAGELLQLCATEGITLGNLFHGIWAIMLHLHTDMDEVCFKHVSSGRDARIDGINDAVGPFYNILLSKAHVSQNTRIDAFLSAIHEDFLQVLPHQGVPLPAVRDEHGRPVYLSLRHRCQFPQIPKTNRNFYCRHFHQTHHVNWSTRSKFILSLSLPFFKFTNY
jgi:hypothetical protein